MKKLVKESLYENESLKRELKSNIEKETIQNNNFRKVLYTGKNLQLVLMSLKPGEDIGEEIHKNDQFFRVEEGNGKVIINNVEYKIKDGSGIIVPAGVNHNIINTGESALKLYTIYGSPHHKDGVILNTKKK